MTNVTPIYQNLNSCDLMTTGETAKLLRRSLPTIRALTERSWHPLPCVNTGTAGKRKQRLFLRSSIMRWLEEEQAEAKAS